jgi:flavin reductase (DIM6/NTAB) family NADH-FMN oxidoreductase RutF
MSPRCDRRLASLRPGGFKIACEMLSREARLSAEVEADVMTDAIAFKKAMRQLASGVFVVTSRLDDRPHATTATAFLPLSAEPPLVLVCVHRDSDTHRALSQVTHFGINMLSSAQAALSTRFSGKSAERYRFDDVPRFEGPHRSLFFRDSAAHIEVETQSTTAGGDHTIFIARVLWLQSDAKLAPLVYHRGGHHLLQPIEALEAAEPTRRAG